MDFSLSHEQAALRDSIRKAPIDDWTETLTDDEHAGKFSWEGWKRFAELGYLGLPLPPEHGGSGADLLTTLVAIETLGQRCRDSGLVHALVSQMLCGMQIATYGTDEQKQSYLPRISTGEIVCAQALTEPDAGSDVAAIRTRAERSGDEYVLNGAKAFISNGPIADLVVVYAVTGAGRKALGGLSCFIVKKDLLGFSRSKAIEKMGLRTLQNGELVFQDCRLSANQLLGFEGQAMLAFNQVMEWERCLLFGAHLGTMQRVLEQCVRYAKERSQFGGAIARFQSVSHKIANMKVSLELGRLMLYKAAWLKDGGQRVPSKLRSGSSLSARACSGRVSMQFRSTEPTDTRRSLTSRGSSGTASPQRSTRVRRRSSGTSSPHSWASRLARGRVPGSAPRRHRRGGLAVERRGLRAVRGLPDLRRSRPPVQQGRTPPRRQRRSATGPRGPVPPTDVECSRRHHGHSQGRRSLCPDRSEGADRAPAADDRRLSTLGLPLRSAHGKRGARARPQVTTGDPDRLSRQGADCRGLPGDVLPGSGASGGLSGSNAALQEHRRRSRLHPVHIGTTGRPKGVMVTHRNVLDYAGWVVDYFGISSEDKVLATAPFHFDMSTFDVFSALKSRARLCICPEEFLLFPARLLSYLEERGSRSGRRSRRCSSTWLGPGASRPGGCRRSRECSSAARCCTRGTWRSGCASILRRRSSTSMARPRPPVSPCATRSPRYRKTTRPGSRSAALAPTPKPFCSVPTEPRPRGRGGRVVHSRRRRCCRLLE